MNIAFQIKPGYKLVWVWAQPLRDDFTLQYRLSLAEPIPRKMPENPTDELHVQPEISLDLNLVLDYKYAYSLTNRNYERENYQHK